MQEQYALHADGDYKFSNLHLPVFGETNLKISFGVREGYRDVQQTFGRYLINGDYNNYGITGAAPGPATTCTTWIRATRRPTSPTRRPRPTRSWPRS